MCKLWVVERLNGNWKTFIPRTVPTASETKMGATWLKATAGLNYCGEFRVTPYIPRDKSEGRNYLWVLECAYKDTGDWFPQEWKAKREEVRASKRKKDQFKSSRQKKFRVRKYVAE